MKNIKKIIAVGVSVLPMLAFAAVSTFGGLIDQLISVINTIIGFLLVAAVAWIIYGAFQYIMNSGDEEKRKEGQQKLIHGLIGIVVMVGVWGLIQVAVSVFGLETSSTIKLPVLQK